MNRVELGEAPESELYALTDEVDAQGRRLNELEVLRYRELAEYGGTVLLNGVLTEEAKKHNNKLTPAQVKAGQRYHGVIALRPIAK